MAYNLGTDYATGLKPPGQDGQAVQPEVQPQPRPGFAGWWDALGEDKQSALKMAALSTGLSMMAQGPSRVPVTAAETIGKAGLTGLNTYTTQLNTGREMALKTAELGLKNREVAAKEGELDVNKGKAALENRLWSEGAPATTAEAPTGKYAPMLGNATPESKYNLGGNPESPYGFNVPGSKLLNNAPAPENYGGLANAQTKTVVTNPGKPAGLKARKEEAEIKEKESVARKNSMDKWDIKDGWMIDKYTGEHYRVNPNKEVDKVVDAKDRSVVYYKDGTADTIKHGLAPQYDLDYVEKAARAKALGKDKGEQPTYTKIEGKAFDKFTNDGWATLSPQEQQIVAARLEKTDPDMAQAAKVINNDISLVGKKADVLITKQIEVYNQIKQQRGPEAWKNTTDKPVSLNYKNNGLSKPPDYKSSLDSFMKKGGKKALPPLSSFDNANEE